jgi:hypothetical protein
LSYITKNMSLYLALVIFQRAEMRIDNVHLIN